MNWRAITAGIALVALVEGVWISRHLVAHGEANRQAAAELAATAAAHRRTDSLQAAVARADSIRRAADDQAVTVSRAAADNTSATVTHELAGVDSTLGDMAVCDSAALDSLRARFGRLQLAWIQHFEADSLVRVVEDRRHRADSARIATLELVELPALRHERDSMRTTAEDYLARAIMAERGWSPLRRVVTGLSCVASGVLVVVKEWVPAVATGGACAVSLALP